MDDPAPTRGKHGGAPPFKPGQSGNPAGRAKGSRNKLGEAFIQALYEDFGKHGKKVIQAVRTDKPDAYLKVVASILPKELNVRVSDLDDLSDSALDHRIRALAAALDITFGIGETSGREETPAQPQSAGAISTIQ